MMKFFRTHKKHLLAFFMACLLVIWLLEGTLNKGNGRDGDGGISMEWGDVYGKTVSGSQIASIQRSTEILDFLHRGLATRENPNPPMLNWRDFWGGGGMIRKPLQVREWYMLNAEAQHRGIQVPADEVESVKARLPAGMLTAARDRMRASPEEINGAIESWLRVVAAFDTDFRSLKMSEADVQAFARDMYEKAKVKLAVLDTKLFEDPAYQPTPEELQQQFNKYKNVEPGTGPDGYGYRLPEEVQIEYILIKADELAKAQKIDEEDAEKYWRNNQAKFTKPRPPTSTAPAEKYKTYSEAREAVHKELATQKAKEEALRLATDLIKTLTTPWSKQPTTRPGYKTPPDVAIMPNPYTPLLEDMVKRHGSKAVIYGRTPFLSRQDLSTYQTPTDSPMDRLPMLSGALAMRGSREQVSLVLAAFLVPDVEHSEAEKKNYARWFHNYYETLPESFVDEDGNVYVFRTLGGKPKREPQNLQEVKNDQVRKDLKAMQAAKVTKARAEQLLARAKQVGLEAAVKEDPALVAKLAPPPATQPGQPALPAPDPIKAPTPFGRKQWMRPTEVPEVGEDPEGKFIALVFGMAGKTAPADKVGLFENDEHTRFVVTELESIQPATEQEYNTSRSMAGYFVTRGMMMKFASAWLDGKNIRARVGFVPKYPEQDKQDDRETD